MKKLFFILTLLMMSGVLYAQENYEFQEIEETAPPTPPSAPVRFEDRQYPKDKAYEKERTFSEDPKRKYGSDDAFNYTEDKARKKKEPKEENQSTTNNSNSSSGGSGAGIGFSFLGNLLPWILVIALVCIVIIAILRGAGMSSIGMKRYKTADAEKLLSEEEELIDEGDFERLVARAIQNRDFRLATRYYYLWLLQKLSEKKYIEYHKDKTNSEYLFELEDKTLRSGFSYVSYIYSYIWYGEFPVDEVKFATISEKYKSFMSQIK